MASNKKRISGESETGGKDLSRAKWSKETLHLFCDLCIQYAEKSKEKNGTAASQRMAWKVLEVEFQKMTNLAYGRNQLKNKWDWMKSRWSLWKALKGNETGLTWDNEKGTISASEEWWKKKIEENMHFRAFRDEGIEPELESKMEQLFGASISSGVDLVMDSSQREKETVPVPCSPPMLNVGDAPFDCDDELSENSACNHSQANIEWQELWNDQSPIPSPTPLNFTEYGVRGRRSKRLSDNDALSESNKRSCRSCFARRVGVKMLEEKIDALVKVVTERNIKKMELTNLEERKLDDSSQTVADSMARLVSIPGLIHGSPEFCFACTLIEDPQKRTILHGIPDDHSRLQWIKFLYEKHRNERV
ncbi:L10-interacting MYB domain-containing protein [Bienertia sinuspersici]